MHLSTPIEIGAKSAMFSALDDFKQLLDTIETISIDSGYALKTTSINLILSLSTNYLGKASVSCLDIFQALDTIVSHMECGMG